MDLRRAASRALLLLGALALLGALGFLLASYLLPAEGLEDLARVTGALLLAGAAGVAAALGLFAARDAPRWMLGVGVACCVAGLLAGTVMARTLTQGGLIFGVVFLLASLAGIGRVAMLARSS